MGLSFVCVPVLVGRKRDREEEGGEVIMGEKGGRKREREGPREVRVGEGGGRGLVRAGSLKDFLREGQMERRKLLSLFFGSEGNEVGELKMRNGSYKTTMEVRRLQERRECNSSLLKD